MHARNRPRLVATDLDGTLLRSDGQIAPRTRAALRRAEESGAMVVFISGRPPRHLDVVADAVGDHGLAIGANGALVYDVVTRRVVRERGLPAADAMKAATALRTAAPGVSFAIERGLIYGKEPAYDNRWALPDGAVIAELEVLLAEPVAKLLARHEDLDADDFTRLGAEAVGGLATVTSSEHRALLEISAPGVSKASALAELCAERGIGADEVVAFGDMPNDLEMLRWAGTSYAMGNAHPAVAEAAGQRCATNDCEGVAEVLERLFP